MLRIYDLSLTSVLHPWLNSNEISDLKDASDSQSHVVFFLGQIMGTSPHLGRGGGRAELLDLLLSEP